MVALLEEGPRLRVSQADSPNLQAGEVMHVHNCCTSNKMHLFPHARDFERGWEERSSAPQSLGNDSKHFSVPKKANVEIRT